MLHCNMTHPSDRLRLGLDDLVGDLVHARRQGDLGRLATLCYCEVRRWARLAGETALADHSSRLFTQEPPGDRQAFLAEVDALIVEIRSVHDRWHADESFAAPRPVPATPLRHRA